MKRIVKTIIKEILITYLKVINSIIDFIGYIYSTEMPHLVLREWVNERL